MNIICSVKYMCRIIHNEQFDPVDFKMQNMHTLTRVRMCRLVWVPVCAIPPFSSLGSGQKLQPWQQDPSYHLAAATVWSFPTEICQ